MYSLLISPPEDFMLSYLSKWELNLNKTFVPDQRRNIINFSLNSYICTSVQETNYKLLTWLYRTPLALHRYYPKDVDRCWRCREERGSLFHIFLVLSGVSPPLERGEETYSTIYRLLCPRWSYFLPPPLLFYPCSDLQEVGSSSLT